jgi:AcrR family transcriptional regulator
VGTRRYDTTARRAAAEERRRRVVAVAAERFGEHGWTGTTLAGIAAAAGVSPEYVTKTFGNKAALLLAAIEQVGFSGHGDVADAFAALNLDAVADFDERLDAVVEFSCATLARLAPLVPVLVVGAEQSPALRDAVRSSRDAHARSTAAAVRLLAGADASADAVDEVYVLTRAETYLAFVTQRGWDTERYAAWLRRVLPEAIARR